MSEGKLKPFGNASRSPFEEPLKPVAGLDADGLLAMTEQSYIDLVQWTGEHAHPNKRGKLEEVETSPPDVIQILARTPQAWMRQVQGTESRYYRAIGSAEALMAKAAELHQTWMKGVAGERALQILRERPT